MTKRTLNRFSPEVRQRAVRMVLDHGGDHASQWSAIGLIAAKIGCTAETLRKWVRQGERDQGLRTGSTTAEPERVRLGQGMQPAERIREAEQPTVPATKKPAPAAMQSRPSACGTRLIGCRPGGRQGRRRR